MLVFIAYMNFGTCNFLNLEDENQKLPFYALLSTTADTYICIFYFAPENLIVRCHACHKLYSLKLQKVIQVQKERRETDRV